MLYYAYGTALLTREECAEVAVNEKVSELVRSVAMGRRSSAPIDLLNGVFSAEMAAERPPTSDVRVATAWQPIGLGKPVTLDIREVYTGKNPSGFFSGTSPMLVASAVKSVAAYDAKPRAINFLSRKIGKNTRLARPKAAEEGTPIMFHSPAMVDRSITFDASIVFDEFPQQAFDAVGSAFKSAAGLPVFLTHSLYLLAAGEIARIAGAAGEAIFDGKPVFDTSQSIDLALPGRVPTAAGFMLVVQADIDHVDPTFRDKYHVANGTLVDKAGNPYTGDIPYMIVAVDGSARDDLANFSPTAASAAVLSRFFGIKDGQSLSLDPLLDALKLYNDFSFRTDLDKLDKRLAPMKEGPEKEALKEKREALLKNITTDLLRPSP